MDREYLKQLVDEVAAQSDDDKSMRWMDNYNKRLEELKKDLDETINYIDTCSEKELFWVSEVFDELSEYFQSQKLIDAVERNVKRFDSERLQDLLKAQLDDMRHYLHKK